MATVTGFNEANVNEAIATVDHWSKAVMNTVTTNFNLILTALSENWGTTDGKTWVTEELISSLQKVGGSVAEILREIGSVIKSTGEQQAQDTNNAVSINTPTLQELGDLINKMDDKLDNGFVGIYDDLKDKVKTAHANMNDSVATQLNNLKSNVKSQTDKAFQEIGAADKVSSELEEYIDQIKKTIDSALKKLEESVDESTASADTYAHDIQKAGLRGSGSATSGGTAATSSTFSELN